MSYLIIQDYYRLIQDVTLQQVISGNYSLVSLMESAALSEIISYLTAKYDTSVEFNDIQLFNPTANYKFNDRVYLDAPAYNSGSTYALNSLCLYNGNIYLCKVAITIGEVFTSSKWTLLGAQYQLFYVTLPAGYTQFDLFATYVIESKVFYKNHTYSALRPTLVYDHMTMLQFENTNYVPYNNYFPDDTTNGSAYWHDEGAYTVSGAKITDSTIFVPGDNRNQQLVNYMIDITIYHLYSRIPPQVIPQQRVDRYMLAIGWLKQAKDGKDITPDLPKRQPPAGRRIRSGTNIKQINTY